MNTELPVNDPFWDSFFKSDITPTISIGDHKELQKELASSNLKLIAYRDELKKLQIENALLVKLIKGTI
jgi:hypothetical protein